MQYFHLGNEYLLRKLSGFKIIEGHPITATGPVIEGEVLLPHRESPDFFEMIKSHHIENTQPFLVIDENAMLYECVFHTITTTTDGHPLLGGIVKRHGAVSHKDKVLEIIKDAKKRVI